MERIRTCILGGCGFVGRAIAHRLSSAGHQVTVLTRHRERNRDLLVHPSIRVVEADVYDRSALSANFSGMDAVINLIGILNESRRPNQTFQRAHVDLAEMVMQALGASGVSRLLHMSAAVAHPSGPSRYLASKGEAENLVHELGPAQNCRVTSFRPSVIFGPGDDFTNRFAALLRQIPLAFPLACPQSRLQPVYVNDVAACFVHALEDPDTIGQRYDLCGPRAYTLREIVEYIARTIGVRRAIIGLPDWSSRMQAAVMQWFPGKPFTPDNYLSLQVASVCGQPFPAVFDLTPRSLEEIAPGYLKREPEKLDIIRRGVP